MSFTFTQGSFDATLDDDEVVDAVAYGELSIETPNAYLKSFYDTIEMQIDVLDYEGEVSEDPDEDYNAVIMSFDFISIDGNIDSLDISDKDIVKILEYCNSRGLIFSAEDEEMYSPEFIKLFDKKPITKELLDTYCKFLTQEKIEIEDADIFPLQVVKVAKSLNSFSDTPYGNIGGSTVNNDIDASGYGLKTLSGSPKIVKGEFNIMGSDLDSLKYGPEEVKTLLVNNLTDLQYLPYVRDQKNSSINISWGDDSTALKKELKYRLGLNNTYGMSSVEIRTIMYEETGDEDILPKDVQEMFIF